MDNNTIFCRICGKKIVFDPSQPPSLCPRCDSKLNIKPPEPARQSGVQMLEIQSSEYSNATANTDFCGEQNQRLMTGWLPEGYTASAKTEPNKGDTDTPLVCWAYAKKQGKEWFCRRYKKFRIDKLKESTDVCILYDEFLDRNAIEILGTHSVRLIMRVPAPDDDLQEVREILMKRKQDLEKISSDSYTCVVQAEYGALGGKLYEAEINGRKKYLFLDTYILADEYGSYSPMLIRSQNQTNAMLNSIRSMVGNPYGNPYGSNQYQEIPMPKIDTDPNTPFGKHRTDGFTSSTVIWNIVEYGGFLSDTMPDRSEICDFMRFTHSLKISPEMQNMLNNFQQQIMMQNMMAQQQMMNIMQQGAAAHQREMDRHNSIMRGIRADMDNITQQRIASQNQAFDNSARKSHEMIMGVNTYTGADGRRIEADVSIDRVFQHQNDPSIIIGASSTADIPPNFTELEKMK